MMGLISVVFPLLTSVQIVYRNRLQKGSRLPHRESINWALSEVALDKNEVFFHEPGEIGNFGIGCYPI